MLIVVLLASTAAAQEDWEGAIIEDVVAGDGWHLVKPRSVFQKLNAKKGAKYGLEARDDDYKVLYNEKLFENVRIEIVPVEGKQTIIVKIHVVEAPVIKDVIFSGLNAIPLTGFRKDLTLNPGERLSAYNLKRDRDTIREQYLLKGYHFSSVREEIVPTEAGVILHWQITEGPPVGVREIIFSGNEHIDSGTLKDAMQTKENSRLLFIPASTNPFVMRFLEEDIKRIKLEYQFEGFIDIVGGDRVFVEDLVFNDDKTEVTIKIHVDEGRRYRIRRITFRGNNLFRNEELLAELSSKVGADYSERVVAKDAIRLRDKYGERAYILAEINPQVAVDLIRNELDISFEIKENEEIRIGRITVSGNYKTRTDVILRELKDFTPGQKFNNRMLNRGILRLRDRGYFDSAPDGILPHLEPGEGEDIRDVVIDVKEGQTGNIRFAGGYSSTYGIIGILELTQRNFDIADIPKSLEDFFNGTAFAGGGQYFGIRLSPSARRQSFTVNFREPYLFGYEYGFGVGAYDVRTQREDWTVGRLGGSISIDKRIDNFRFELAFSGSRMSFDGIDPNAPSEIVALEGNNRLYTLTPAVIFDTRDSAMFPSEGVRIALGYTYAGQVLPGDFDYWKMTFDTDLYFTIYETEGEERQKLKHVLQFHGTFGLADEARLSKTVFIEERFYAGGRDSIRGFDFRGVGPHENGDPIGGEAYVFGSVEYSIPFITQELRIAAFYDVANLSSEFSGLSHEIWRQTVGFGIRFMIRQLGNVPFALDFGFPLRKADEDERETVTFDFGKLF